MKIQEELAAAATRLVSELNADAILTLTETGRTYELIHRSWYAKSLIRRATGLDRRKWVKLVAATPNQDTYERLKKLPHANVIKLAIRAPSRMDQVQHAVWRGLRDGIFWEGDLVICLVGDTGSPGGTDTIFIHRIKEPEVKLAEIIETDPILASVVNIAIELCGSYRGEPMGTAFVIGDVEAVKKRSRELIPNPFEGHEEIYVTNHEHKEIIKRYAYLDGAFIIDDRGRVLTAGQYLDADAEIEIPKGFGTRHRAVASMTAATESRGVTVSGSDGMVRIFKDGRLVARIDPRKRMWVEMME